MGAKSSKTPFRTWQAGILQSVRDMTSIVYDFDAIRQRMPGAAPPGDRRILRLFRNWQAGILPNKAQQLVDAIAETPAEGLAGLAIKVYFAFRGLPNGPNGDDDIDPIDEAMLVSLTEDIVRLVPEVVPELAPLVAPTLAPRKAD